MSILGPQTHQIKHNPAPTQLISSSTPFEQYPRQINIGEAYISLISSKNWDVPTALAIMSCESGASSTIHNLNPITGDDSYGLFQINLAGKLKLSRPIPEELKNPVINIDYAYSLWKLHKWGDWQNCYRKVTMNLKQ